MMKYIHIENKYGEIYTDENKYGEIYTDRKVNMVQHYIPHDRNTKYG